MNLITHNPFHLRGKTILVTGASSGIGRAVAIQCAAVGARVVLTGRDGARLADTRAQMVGGDHVTVLANLCDAAQLAALADQAGPLDGVVHAAGVSGVMPMRMLREAFLDQVFDANVAAPVLLTQRLLQKKFLRDAGSILFLSSIAAHTGTAGIGPYSASKSALLGIVRCLALELAPRGMRVNALAPGLVDTPLINRDQEWLAAQARLYPLGLGRPEDVAYGAIYFLSDASRKVTGTSFHMDGGVAWI